MRARTPGPRALAAAAAAFVCTGCTAQATFDRGFVSSELASRGAGGLPETIGPEVVFPPQVSLGDGMSAPEAVAIALWNNAEFHATLSELGIARADLVEAGLLPNPVLSLVFPGNSKAREGTINVPIQLLQRPARISIARLDAERIAHELLQNGLSLVRDVRTAHAELHLARTREALVGLEAELLNEIADIAAGQLAAGRISELEAARAEADALTATASVQDAMRQAAAARHRLSSLLGLTQLGDVDLAATAEVPAQPLPDLAVLIDLALASRPDLRAAELAVEAAAQSADWERRQTYDFLAVLDLDQEEGADLETGPGFEFELPIFDRNQGGKLRAAARLEQAALRYTATRRSIVLDVGESYAAYDAALEAARAWQEEIVPRLETTVEDTERAFSLGSVSELTVMQAEQRLLAARLAGAEAWMELERASAELGRSVGQRVDGQP